MPNKDEVELLRLCRKQNGRDGERETTGMSRITCHPIFLIRGSMVFATLIENRRNEVHNFRTNVLEKESRLKNSPLKTGLRMHYLFVLYK